MQNNNITGDKKKQGLTLGLSKIDRLSARKALANVLASVYDKTPFWRYASIIRGCAETMIVRRYEGGALEVAYTMFCGARLCPICAWRRSLKAYNQLSRIMDALDAERVASDRAPYAYNLITLTLRNCSGEDLPEILDHMYDSFTRLTHRREWRAAIVGAWRTVEITYNVRDDSYHPHFHVIVAVQPSYFTSKVYISQDKLAKLWKACAKIAYTPIVDIRRVAVSADHKDLREVTKYATKVTGVITDATDTMAAQVLANLHGALHGRKLFAAYGSVREMSRKLRMSDEDGQLLDVTDSDSVLANSLRADVAYTVEAYTYAAQSGYIHIDGDLFRYSDLHPIQYALKWSEIRHERDPKCGPTVPLEEDQEPWGDELDQMELEEIRHISTIEK